MSDWKLRPNKRRFAIGLYLLSGWTVWGVDLASGDSRSPRLVETSPGRFVMCCGHVLQRREIECWLADGLLAEGEVTAYGARTLVAGERLDRWVSAAWHGLLAKSWVR